MKRLNKIAQIIIDWQKQGKSHTQDGRKPNDTRTRSIKIEWPFRINCNKLTVYAKKKNSHKNWPNRFNSDEISYKFHI